MLYRFILRIAYQQKLCVCVCVGNEKGEEGKEREEKES